LKTRLFSIISCRSTDLWYTMIWKILMLII